jgi:hypothetical protein
VWKFRSIQSYWHGLFKNVITGKKKKKILWVFSKCKYTEVT